MSITITPRMGLTRYGADSDEWSPDDMRGNVDKLEASAALYGVGLASARPAATAARKGMVWGSTDTGAVDFCTGAQWVALVQAPGSTNADTLDGLDSTAFLLATGKAANSELLDGYDSTAFRKVTDPVDAATLDGLDSPVFARRDQANTFTSTINAAGVYDGGNRAYSLSNPPPVSGAVIVQTIRGVLTVPNTGTETFFTIPAVNPAKTQLRYLGQSYLLGHTSEGARIRLASSTQIAAVAIASNGTNDSFLSYELTEWS